MNNNLKQRCSWCEKSELMIQYHDTEWAVPVHDDRKHFEFIVLDGFQAGLSWEIVLKKREAFRKAFENFDPNKVAAYSPERIEDLLVNPEIIRNKLKINAAVTNAQAFLKVQAEFGSFDKFIWQFTDGKTLVNKIATMSELPASSKESDAMSKELKKRGFKFVGTTICYAYMQASGMVNDHLSDCFRFQELINEIKNG